MQNNEYKSYTLFNDVADTELRTYNRATILSNIAEFHTKAGKVNAKGVALLTGYFDKIPDIDKKSVYEKFHEVMKERGYVTV